MTEKMIIDAYCRIRTIDNTIPDDVLDFMKDAALEALTKQTDVNLPVMQAEWSDVSEGAAVGKSAVGQNVSVGDKSDCDKSTCTYPECFCGG